MPHEVVIHGERLPLHDVLDVGHAAGGPLLRFLRLPGGDAAVIAATDATRDGRPLVGNLGVVDWGTSALLRAGGLRAEVAWRAGGERRRDVAGGRCRLCFGAFAPGETAVGCRCQVLFHEDCDRARLDCPACGAVREEVAP
jgi:hypothetical protein